MISPVSEKKEKGAMRLKQQTVYLDNAATTRIKPEVLEKMRPFLSEKYGNPSGVYSLAGESKEAIDEARGHIAELLNCMREEIYFTSGGSESDNWALRGVALANREKGNHIITTKIEQASAEDLSLLLPTSATALRTEEAKKVLLGQKFVLKADTDGVQIEVHPRAAVKLKDETFYSKENEDKQNAITLIPDAKAPSIVGVSALENAGNIDMTETDKDFVIQATDDGSGMRSLVVTILNQDNKMIRTYTSADGILTITMAKDDYLFLGDFAVTAEAIDNVGNVSIHESDKRAFTLKAELKRARFPHNENFKAGDGAILEVVTGGYADEVIIRFPDELLSLNPELNQEYVYEFPEAIRTETYSFNIPLGTPSGNFSIEVEAWKNDTKLTEELELPVRIAGSILEEFRTRIRDNGV